MQGSKIRLSPAEAALFNNAEVILTKNSVLQKTVALLADIQRLLTVESQAFSFSSTPKISKGENYLGLPYVVLDFPRITNGSDLFFIRSMFWWGKFYSSTLQVAGTYKEKSLQAITEEYDTLAGQNYFIGINADPWEHHFEATNYQPIQSIKKENFNSVIEQQLHIKIAAQWPLSQWDLAANHLLESWRFLAGLVA